MIKIQLCGVEDRKKFEEIKKEKFIELDKRILKEIVQLKKDIKLLIDDLKKELKNVDIDIPTLEEESETYYNSTSSEVQIKVEVYDNYKNMQKWISHLENNVFYKITEENLQKNTGGAYSSYFSRMVYNIPNEMKWIRNYNVFRGHKVIDIPHSLSVLLVRVTEYVQDVREYNRIVEDECLLEYLLERCNVNIN